MTFADWCTSEIAPATLYDPTCCSLRERQQVLGERLDVGIAFARFAGHGTLDDGGEFRGQAGAAGPQRHNGPIEHLGESMGRRGKVVWRFVRNQAVQGSRSAELID